MNYSELLQLAKGWGNFISDRIIIWRLRMNTSTVARKKKDLKPMEDWQEPILGQYQPKSVEDMQSTLKDIFGPMFEAIL